MNSFYLSRFLGTFFLLVISFVSTAASKENYHKEEAKNTTEEIVKGDLETGQWHFSLAIGAGFISNPLIGGENIPLLFVPDVAYYGDQFYFDNGDFGYTFKENEHSAFGFLTRFNFEKAYFSKSHPANIFIRTDSGNNTPDIQQQNSIEDIQHRDYAIDAGVQFNYYFSDTKNLRIQFLKDVSGVYRGLNGSIEYMTRSEYQHIALSASIGFAWKSRELVDYYYGIDESDNLHPLFSYQGKSSINPYFELTTVFPINTHWDFISLFKYSRLGTGINESPIVKESSTITLYFGAAYQF